MTSQLQHRLHGLHVAGLVEFCFLSSFGRFEGLWIVVVSSVIVARSLVSSFKLCFQRYLMMILDGSLEVFEWFYSVV